ncbi:hypothetical protein ACQY1Q_04240 [Tenacibaculum sp. TC6]|uniref:hypothetical protein n=1 Tax=Tenacibaculum sp. TC6 TaxID=3423223 RepID=UPI003D35E7C6
MKKLVALLVFSLGILLFVSCTDNSLEDIEKNEKKHTKLNNIQLTDPDDDGTVDDEEYPNG